MRASDKILVQTLRQNSTHFNIFSCYISNRKLEKHIQSYQLERYIITHISGYGCMTNSNGGCAQCEYWCDDYSYI